MLDKTITNPKATVWYITQTTPCGKYCGIYQCIISDPGTTIYDGSFNVEYVTDACDSTEEAREKMNHIHLRVSEFVARVLGTECADAFENAQVYDKAEPLSAEIR